MPQKSNCCFTELEVLRGKYSFLLVKVPSTKLGLEKIMEEMANSFWSGILVQRTTRVLPVSRQGHSRAFLITGPWIMA